MEMNEYLKGIEENVVMDYRNTGFNFKGKYEDFLILVGVQLVKNGDMEYGYNQDLSTPVLIPRSNGTSVGTKELEDYKYVIKEIASVREYELLKLDKDYYQMRKL